MVLYGLLPDALSLLIVFILIAMVFIHVGSNWLEESAEELSAYYGLPAVIQGSVVVAIGSSFPELASVVFAAWGDSFDLGVGAVVGSAIFNILVIPAMAGILTEEPVDANRTLVYKEAQFYMLAVSAMVITFALAVIYNPTDSSLGGTVTRRLAVIPVLLYVLYVFIQWQDVADHDAEAVTDVDVLSQWALLIAGLIVILVAVEQLVHAVEVLATDVYDVNTFLAGVTILAAATSVPDALVSIRAARDGKGVTSIGNVLGSNTFDLLVAIPAGVLIAGSLAIDFAIAVPMMGVLTVATIVLFVMLRTDLELTTVESYGLLITYLLFVAWVVAETIGVTGVLRGA